MKTLYKCCPLCGGKAALCYKSTDISKHPAYFYSLPAYIHWMLCNGCGHIYTDGYWTDEALAVILSRARSRPDQLRNLENIRLLNAPIVSWVTSFRGGECGRWLDVGCGDGGLLFTAKEFGYSGYGLDLRPESIKEIEKEGIKGSVSTVEDFLVANDEPFDVISFADSIEHMPFPVGALRAARSLLKDDGCLFVSCPNTDTVVWKRSGDANPYWTEFEHLHNFSRARMTALLVECGFERPQYRVSERYRSGMELLSEVSS